MKKRQGLTGRSFFERVTDKLDRRTFIGRVTGGVLLAGGAIPALTGDAFAFQTSGCSDSDPTDPGGNGRRCTPAGPMTGCSDSDPTDPGGRGRRCGGGGGSGGGGGGGSTGPATGCSDRDPTDPGGRGRNCGGGGSGGGGGGGRTRSGCSDSDPSQGRPRDPGGDGRYCIGPGNTPGGAGPIRPGENPNCRFHRNNIAGANRQIAALNQQAQYPPVTQQNLEAAQWGIGALRALYENQSMFTTPEAEARLLGQLQALCRDLQLGSPADNSQAQAMLQNYIGRATPILRGIREQEEVIQSNQEELYRMECEPRPDYVPYPR